MLLYARAAATTPLLSPYWRLVACILSDGALHHFSSDIGGGDNVRWRYK